VLEAPSQPHAWAPTVLTDELDPSFFEGPSQLLKCLVAELLAALKASNRVRRDSRRFGEIANTPPYGCARQLTLDRQQSEHRYDLSCIRKC